MSAWPPTTHIPEWNSTLQYILITNKDTKPQHRSVSITPVVALHRFQYVDYIHFALCRNGEMRANQHPVRCWHHLALSPPLTSHLCPRLPLTSSRLSEHFIMPCSQRSTSFGLCDPCTVLRSLSFYSYLSLPPSMNWNTFNDAWNTEMRKNKILFFTFSQWTNWIPLSDILFCMIRSELLQNEEGAIAKDFKNSRNQALWHEISRTMTYHLYSIGDF